MAQPYYITLSDITDAALATHANVAYLQKLERYIQNLAKMRGVDIAQVPKPLRSFAFDLAVAYVCMTIAMEKSGVNAHQAGAGVELDIYMVKEKQWRKEFERLEPIVSGEVLLDVAETPAAFASSIRLFRG